MFKNVQQCFRNTSPEVMLSSYDQTNYPMNSKSRGIAYLVDIPDGKSTKSSVDVDRIRKVLQALKFHVIEPKDKTMKCIFDQAEKSEFIKESINDEIKQFTLIFLSTVASMNHSKNDCFVLVVLTHDEKNGQLRASDGYFYAKHLFDSFMSSNSKTLVGKPKLFFVQACQGKKLDSLRAVGSFDDIDTKGTPAGLITVPSAADHLIMYSTPEFYATWRSNDDGSWFIQALCDQLETNFSDDLMTMLTTVNRIVAIKVMEHTKDPYLKDSKQIPVIVSSLTKKIFIRNQPA